MIYDDRAKLRADIRAHLVANGSRNWRLLRYRYSAVPPATWWRLIAREKARIGTQHLVTSDDKIVTARAWSAAEGELKGIGASTLVAGVPGGRFDFLAAFRNLFADATKLRAHAFRADGSVRNPILLDRAVKLRFKLIRQGLELERQIYSANAQRAFFAALVDEIAAESPEVSHRLISRLRAFNRQFDTRSKDSSGTPTTESS